MSKWKKSKLLGVGSVGNVFLANKDDTLIAVKSVNCNEFSKICSMKVEEMFLKEVNGEPNIIGYFGRDFSKENGKKTFNLLLEYAAGGHLDMLLASSPQTDQTHIAYLTRMLLIALSRIHALGIVHCDLTPRNILVFPSEVEGHPPKLKIADFGIAEWVSRPSVVEDPDKKFQHRGIILYSSPESVARGEYGTSADIWSLGIIVGEMMNPGDYFYSFDDEDEDGDGDEDEDEYLYDLIVHQPLDVEEKVPDHFEHRDHAIDFLKKCLDKDPANRWSAQQLLNHPFITENLKNHFVGDDRQHIKVENPIKPSNQWVDSRDLFTDDYEELQILDETLLLRSSLHV